MYDLEVVGSSPMLRFIRSVTIFVRMFPKSEFLNQKKNGWFPDDPVNTDAQNLTVEETEVLSTTDMKETELEGRL